MQCDRNWDLAMLANKARYLSLVSTFSFLLLEVWRPVPVTAMAMAPSLVGGRLESSTPFSFGVLSTSLTALLFTSVWYLGDGWQSFVGTSLLFTGECHTASRVNVALHVAVNAISTLVLASSNFFMQVLSAPTRDNVDKAHERGRGLEIGVQSVKNLRYVSTSKRILWFLLALSSVPLHLFFNSCVTEAKASTDFYLVVATASFIHGGNFTAPGVAENNYSEEYPLDTFNPFLATVAKDAATWDKLSLEDCLAIYDDPGAALTTRRHVVMLVDNEGESGGKGWIPDQVRLAGSGYDGPEGYNDTLNPLWLFRRYYRTELAVGSRENVRLSMEPLRFEEMDADNWFKYVLDMDKGSGRITPDPKLFDSSAQGSLQVDHCLSEPFIVPCELRVHDLTLVVVCAFCLIKSVGCLITTIRLRRHDPLLTPGDAIESFIADPDAKTRNMCWISRRPKRVSNAGSVYWISGSQQWKGGKHRVGAAVPWDIWILSYSLFYGILGGVGFLAYLAWGTQELSTSFFGPDARNGGGVGVDEDVQRNPMGGAVFANIPQVALSIAYLAYNGLFTRMLGEREWSGLSVKFQPLRVSRPKGVQKSSYRLQLPFRWSVPLMITSGVLHWLVSNCIYTNLYLNYPALPPYEITDSDVENGLGFSTKAIFITAIISFVLSLVPLVLARFKLPGNMVLAGNNSAVISAACHCIPIEPAVELTDVESIDQRQLLHEYSSNHRSSIWSTTGREERLLAEMSTHRLKWGVVSLGRGTQGHPGHLAFGTVDQDVEPPVEGDWYAGLMDMVGMGDRTWSMLIRNGDRTRESDFEM